MKRDNIKRILLAAMLIPALVLGSCAYDVATEGDKAPAGNILKLSVTVKNASVQNALTRVTVPSEAGEDAIETLYLLFFEPKEGGEGLFVDAVKVENLSGMNVSIPIDMSAYPQLEITGAYNILVVANLCENRYITGGVDTWMRQWAGQSEKQVRNKAFAWVQGSSNAADDVYNAITPDKLLMFGKIVKVHNQFDLTLELSRSVVRFDVYNNQNESYDLVSTELWNVYPSCSIWGSGSSSDFSEKVARIGRFYGVDNSSNFTATAGADGRGNIIGNIAGGLYCFENQVIAPVQNDRFTTCLVIGLKNRAAGTTSYHRVNINPNESPQVLTKNNVYRVTINNVTDGYASAAAAYAAAESGLDYVINYWDMGDYGLIVQDGNSIISIPTKTITFGERGGTLDFPIFTYNNTGATGALTIMSQSYDPSNGTITSILNGNTLIVSATPLASDETQRTGTLVLAYAGLQAKVNIIQTHGDGIFLRVHLPAGGLKPIAPYAGIGSGAIRVEASGQWTAQLFMPDEGFTFDPDALSPTIARTQIGSADPLVANNQFTVYTWSANPNPTKRDAFVLVTLDSDPENYASVIQLAQSPTGGISALPNQSTVTFNGTGTGLAAIAGNNTAIFNVRPSMEDDGNGGEQIANWGWRIIQTPASSNNDVDKFAVSNVGNSQSDAALNTITVGAVGMNTSGRPYTAVLRLYLSLDETTYTDISLVQQSLGISLSPGTMPAVGVVGGRTSPITVVADASLTWSATITTNAGTSPDGLRSLVRHEAILVDQNGTAIVAGTQYPTTTQIRVVFPKVYYPNRDIPISATVTVTVEGMTTSTTVSQTTLTAKSMSGYGMTGSPDYGGLGNTYNRGWDGASGTFGLAQIPGYTRLGVGNMNVTAIPANATYLHVTAHISGSAGTNYNWSVVNNFIDTRDAWTVFSVQATSARNPMNNPDSPLKRNGAGYQDVSYSVSSAWSQVSQVHESSKLYQFVMDRATNPIPTGTPFGNNNVGFYNDGVNCTMPAPWPSTAVVLMTKINNANQASLIVDIKNKFLWIGESQIFWYDSYLDNNRGRFLENLMYFIGNASKYGSHFTDLLLEDGDPDAQPAPWDTAHWGANAGVPSK
jgi:hypothetical protein